MSKVYTIRIYHENDHVEEVKISAKKFTEKYINKKLQDYFTALEGPDDTRIFFSQNQNEIIAESSPPPNKKATEMWQKDGHKDELYGPVLQVPEELATLFFSRFQIVHM